MIHAAGGSRLKMVNKKSTNIQAPSSREFPNIKSATPFFILVVEVSLELGCWSLEFIFSPA
jgi:hypothetical protein